jgi:hypothetical protein
MWNWMGTGTRTYDATARLLERLASALIGFWMGITAARYFGPSGRLYGGLFALMLATMLFWVADNRAKNQSELPSLRTK